MFAFHCCDSKAVVKRCGQVKNRTAKEVSLFTEIRNDFVFNHWSFSIKLVAHIFSNYEVIQYHPIVKILPASDGELHVKIIS